MTQTFHAPATPGHRSPELVRKYFVALPDEQDKEEGTKYVVIGVGIAVGPAVLILAAAASEGDLALAVGAVFSLFVGFVGILIGWRFVLYGARRLLRYHRQLNARNGAPTHHQMEQWLADDIRTVKERAAKELEIPDELLLNDPQFVLGPALPTDYGIGVDGVPRFASYEAAVIYPTKNFISVYTCVINLINGTLDLETTYEFALKEVTAIATVNDRSLAYGGVSSGRAVRTEGTTAYGFVNAADISVRQEFRITLISGNAMSITVGAHFNGQSLTREKHREKIIKAVKSLRFKLREIKNPDDL